MKTFTVCLIFLIIGTSFGYPQARDLKPRNIILIGWDGASRQRVNECLRQGKLSNLKRLILEGSLLNIDITGATDTKAGWAQILTGYKPEVTGVFDNQRFRPIPKGYSLFERLEECLGPDNFVTVAVIAKKNNLVAGPLQLRPIDKQKETSMSRSRDTADTIVVRKGKKYRFVSTKLYSYAKAAADVFMNGVGRERRVGFRALNLLEKYKDRPFFFFVQFKDVDQKGHRYGEDSEQYQDALISLDTWLGRIVEKLQQLNIYDVTLIYVTADHGFDINSDSHYNARDVFLATNDSEIVRHGLRVDIAPTILFRFGCDLASFFPPLDGYPLTKQAQQGDE